MSGAFRVLFLNEGYLGPGAQGHASLEASLRVGLEGIDGVDARFRRLTPLRGFALAATRSVPGLKDVDLDLQTLRWHAVQGLRARRIVRSELRAHATDAVHVHSHAISLFIVRELRRTPTFLSVDATVAGFRAFGLWRPVRPHSELALVPSLTLERRAFRAAAAVLAWTRWARRDVEQACPEANVLEHSPGIDLERFRPAAGAPRERLRVLFVGGNFEKKGGPELVGALAPRLGRDLELDLVTPAAVPPRQGMRVHRFSAADARLVDLYQQADVFCLPSHGDMFPWAVLEAMACGTPVVATAVAGIPEMLADGETGVLVPPGDGRALRSALDALLADAGRRRVLAERARARCEAEYDTRRQTAKLIELMHARARRRVFPP